MSREPVTIVIPVGPEPHHRTWLQEAIDSVEGQLHDHDQLLVILDGDPRGTGGNWGSEEAYTRHLPWRMGVAGAFNAGVGWAWHDPVLMLGADDILLPGAIDACVQAWEDNDRADAYYWMTIEYSDDREDRIQGLPCHAVMVTRSLWEETGGFPPETASGAPDAAFISMLMVHKPEALVPVEKGTPLYWVRVHENQDTAQRGPWQEVMLKTRDILTRRGFQP